MDEDQPQDQPVKLLGIRSLKARNKRALNDNLRLEALRWKLERVEEAEDVANGGASSQSSLPPSSESSGRRSSLSSDDSAEVNDNFEDQGGGSDSDNDFIGVPVEDAPVAPIAPIAPENGLPYLTDFLKNWSKRGVSFHKVDELLKGLNVLYPQLPKSHKVLLQSARKVVTIVPMGQGQFWYKGFASNLSQRLTLDYVLEHGEIIVDINTDGLQLYNKSKLEFWPILGCLKGQKTPFIVACYFGEGHPDNVELFLQDFVAEAQDLQENGYEAFGVVFPFKLRDFILDAPARSMIKCCVGHAAKVACDKCSIEGVSKYSRIVFVGAGVQPGMPRTDLSFEQREQPAHHRGMSPLERDLKVKMISQFRLDGMHMVHGGVFKRWVLYLIGELHRKETAEEQHIRKINKDAGIPQPPFRPHGKISAAAKNLINAAIFDTAPSIPSDFNRRAQDLHHVHFEKCTQFRRRLLYDGIRVFKNIPDNAYKSFLLLHTPIYILSSPKFVKEEQWRTAASEILEQFVVKSVEVFDESFAVFNVHCLSKHLVEECREHGAIDDFSAYKYENYLGSIKHTLRSRNKPLEQLVNRDQECEGWILQKKQEKRDLGLIDLKDRRGENAILDEEFEGNQYRKISVLGFTLSPSVSDCGFVTKTKEIVVLTNVIHCLDGKYSVVEILPEEEDEDKDEETFMEAIPSSWMVDQSKLFAYYPPKELSSKVRRYAMTLKPPDPKTWDKVRINFHHSYDKYNLANRQCNKAVASGLKAGSPSESGGKRRRKKPSRFSSSSEDDPDPKPAMSKQPKHNPQGHLSSILNKSKKMKIQGKSFPNASKNIENSSNQEAATTSKGKGTESPTSINETSDVDLRKRLQDILGKKPISMFSKSSVSSKIAGDSNIQDTASTSKGNSQEVSSVKSNKGVTESGADTDLRHYLSKILSSGETISVSEVSKNIDNLMSQERPSTSNENHTESPPTVEGKSDDSVLDRQKCQEVMLDEDNSSLSLKSINAYDDIEDTDFSNTNEKLHVPSPSGGSDREDEAGEKKKSRFSRLVKTFKNIYTIPDESRGGKRTKPRKCEDNSSDVGVVNFRVMTNAIQELSSKVDILIMNQERILLKLIPEEEMLVRPTGLPSLPISTEEAFEKFEKFLIDDLAFSRTCQFFAGKITSIHDEADATRFLLSKQVTLSNALQRGISWMGTGGEKIAFHDTNMQKAVFCAILKRFPKTDLKIATAATKRWFETSSQRHVEIDAA